MTILFYSEIDDPEPWRRAFARDLPAMAFRVWPDVGDVDEIAYALVWKPRPGLLKTLPKLKAILSLGAGVDGILADTELFAKVADLLAAGKVIGWFRGRMEYGPRALGARSILGDPRSTAMQSLMNVKIKFRESFRPFAPAVLAEHAADWFDLPKGHESPYMLLVAPVRDEHRLPIPLEAAETVAKDPDLSRRLAVLGRSRAWGCRRRAQFG